MVDNTKLEESELAEAVANVLEGQEVNLADEVSVTFESDGFFWCGALITKDILIDKIDLVAGLTFEFPYYEFELKELNSEDTFDNYVEVNFAIAVYDK